MLFAANEGHRPGSAGLSDSATSIPVSPGAMMLSKLTTRRLPCAYGHSARSLAGGTDLDPFGSRGAVRQSSIRPPGQASASGEFRPGSAPRVEHWLFGDARG